ncbi:MAG: RNA polymerase sigma-70 factor [Bacteroidales bacterium]|jgi:RNA polymerase sigma-70 factor (ECF subfamily)|nr:RNA polymerase sigma-70 factor [Bacteroidales bacterium]
MESETESFSRLFVDYRSRFVRFANSYVRDMATAEDITSDAIVYYWENRERLSGDTNVPAYILTTIKNKCLNQLQHIRVREKVNARIQTSAQWDLDMRIASLAALEPAEVYTREIHDLVNTALMKLPEKTRQIFCKSRFDHISNREIAKSLDISIKSVEAHITGAIKLLRSELSDYFLILLILLR